VAPAAPPSSKSKTNGANDTVVHHGTIPTPAWGRRAARERGGAICRPQLEHLCGGGMFFFGEEVIP
jgi:hypothetical protein